MLTANVLYQKTCTKYPTCVALTADVIEVLKFLFLTMLPKCSSFQRFLFASQHSTPQIFIKMASCDMVVK